MHGVLRLAVRLRLAARFAALFFLAPTLGHLGHSETSLSDLPPCLALALWCGANGAAWVRSTQEGVSAAFAVETHTSTCPCPVSRSLALTAVRMCWLGPVVVCGPLHAMLTWGARAVIRVCMLARAVLR